MAVRLQNCQLLTPTTSVFNAARKFFVSCRLRFPVDLPTTANGVIVSRRYTGTFYLRIKSGSIADGHCDVEFILNGPPLRLAGGRVPLGMVNHIAMAYDADDPAVQGIYVNGVYIPFDSSGSVDIGSSTGGIRLTASGDLDCSLEELVVGKEVIPTKAQIRELGELTAATGSVITDLITAGATAYRWTLRGTEGAPAGGVGDPGTTATGSSAWAFGVESGTPLYVADINPANAVVFGEPTVMSSGLVIDVPVLAATDAGLVPTNVMSHDSTIPPSFSVNGGAPVQPTVIVGDSGNYDGLLCLLPDAARINPGDTVTWSVPDGWVVTEVGASPAVADKPVRNRAGKTFFDATQPTMRVGSNYTMPGPAYHSDYKLAANRAKNVNYGPFARKPTGEFTAPASGILFEDINQTKPPKSGRPILLGLRYLAWTDTNEKVGVTGFPYEISIDSGQPTPRVTKIDAMTRDIPLGDGSVRRIRVFEYSRPQTDVTLTADIDATTTTIPISVAPGYPGGSNYDHVLELDGETIIATSRTTSPPQLTNCVRGVKGTAKAHLLGDAGVTSYTQYGGSPTLRITGTADKINYTDLTILGPDDWTPPAEGEPTPDIRVDPLDLSGEFKRQAAEGLGIIRFMDSTPVGPAGYEPEDMRDPNDVSWSAGTTSVRTKFTSVRRFTPGAGEWVYFRHPVPNGQTYAVTLLAPLSAVEAGTKETIEVQGTATEPILIGSRLLAGNEVIRVVSGSGTTWTVERGAGLTTPEAHAAGAIEAGWRLPLLDGAIPLADGVHYELLSTDPHQFNSGLFYDLNTTIGNDANVAARRSGSLTADAASDAATIQVALDGGAGDWPFIAPGLTVVIGSLTFTVASADQTAGTITLTKAVGTALVAGTTFATRSNRILCESLDGTERAWQDVLAYAYNSAVTGPNSVYVSRTPANWPNCVYPVGEQAVELPYFSRERPVSKAFPYELCCKAADYAKAWMIVNVPGMATDDYIIGMARRILAAKKPGGVILLELANEIWNFRYPYFTPYGLFAKWGGIGSTEDYAVLRSKRVFELFQAVFATDGREGELRHYLPWQSGNVGKILDAARRNAVDVDATGCAPYIGHKNPDAMVPLVDATDDDGVVADSWVFTLNRFIGSGSDRGILQSDASNRRKHATLTGRPLLMVHYEGGLERVVPNGAANGRDRNLDVRYHPNYYFADRDHNRIVESRSEADALCVFNNCQGPYSNSTDPNAIDYVWGMNVWGGQKPGYGDGRDGGLDNRLNLFRQGLAQSKTAVDSGDYTKESVRWMAMIDDNKAYFTGIAPDPGDVTPPVVTATTPAAGSIAVAVDSAITATFSEPVTPGSIVFELEAAGVAAPATVAYDAGTLTATLTPAAPLAFATDHAATVSGAADPAGNVMTAVSWSFTTADAPPAPPLPPTTFRESDLRRAVADVLNATGAFDGVYSGAFATIDGRSAEDRRAAAVEPMDSTNVNLWSGSDDMNDSLSHVDCRMRITILARDGNGERCDYISDELLATVFNALCKTSLGGLVLPEHSRLSRWVWRKSTAPERRVEATFQCRYLIDSSMDQSA